MKILDQYKITDDLRKSLEEYYTKTFEMLEKSRLSGRISSVGAGSISTKVSKEREEKELSDLLKKQVNVYKQTEKDLEKLGKQVKGLTEEKNRLEKIYKETGKQEATYLKAKEHLTDATKKLTELKNKQTEAESKIETTVGQLEKSKVSTVKDLFGAVKKVFDGASSGGQVVSGLTKLLLEPAIVGAIGTVAVKVLDQVYASPRQIVAATGAAIESLEGTHLRSLYDKAGVFKEVGFSKERKQALGMAESETRSIWGTISTLLKNPSLLIDTRGGKFEAAQEQLKSQRYQEILEGLKKTQPEKAIALERAPDVYMQALQAQRLLGLSDTEYFGPGGFAKSATSAGFTPEMMAGMAAQMRAAGASTRGMRQLSKLGLQAERGFDLTNAGTVLGRISGIAGGTDVGISQTEQVFKRILKEGVKLGIDGSDFREEQRKFADITSQLIYESSAKTEDQATSVAREFTRFLGEKPTTKELTDATTAYQKWQAGTAETSGRGGTLQFAGLLSAGLGKTGFGGIATLMELEESQLSPTNPLVIAEAIKSGKSTQDFIKILREQKQKAMFRKIFVDPEHMKYLREKGYDKKLSEDELTKLYRTDKKAFDYYLESEEAVTRFPGRFKSLEEREATAERLRKGVITTEDLKKETLEEKGLKEDETTKRLEEISRRGDKVVSAFGEQADQVISKILELGEAAVPTAENIKKLSDEIKKQGEESKKYIEGQPIRGGKWSIPRSQPTVGKSS